MTLSDHIAHLREAIWRGEAQIDARYRECQGDIGQQVWMEEYEFTFQELKRQQKVRKEQLERLLKKQEKE